MVVVAAVVVVVVVVVVGVVVASTFPGPLRFLNEFSQLFAKHTHTHTGHSLRNFWCITLIAHFIRVLSRNHLAGPELSYIRETVDILKISKL